jgi:hypothetical protein
MFGGTRKLIISALAIGLGLNSAAFATADQPSLAHVVQACEEDFKVSFAKLAPYLTPEGKRNVAALQTEAASPR